MIITEQTKDMMRQYTKTKWLDKPRKPLLSLDQTKENDTMYNWKQKSNHNNWWAATTAQVCTFVHSKLCIDWPNLMCPPRHILITHLHLSVYVFSPWILWVSCISLGMMICQHACKAQRLASSNSLTRYSLTPHWRANIVGDCHQRSILISWAISFTRWHLGISSTLFWYKWISHRALVPGLQCAALPDLVTLFFSSSNHWQFHSFCLVKLFYSPTQGLQPFLPGSTFHVWPLDWCQCLLFLCPLHNC